MGQFDEILEISEIRTKWDSINWDKKKILLWAKLYRRVFSLNGTCGEPGKSETSIKTRRLSFGLWFLVVRKTERKNLPFKKKLVIAGWPCKPLTAIFSDGKNEKRSFKENPFLKMEKMGCLVGVGVRTLEQINLFRCFIFVRKMHFSVRTFCPGAVSLRLAISWALRFK